MSELLPTETSGQDDAGVRLLRVAHWMYALQVLGLGVALATAWYWLGFIFCLWPAAIAMGLYKRERRAVLAYPVLATHFEWLKATWWTCLVWLAVGMLLYFVVTGQPINYAMPLIAGVWSLLRLGRGWLMLNKARSMPRRASP